MRKLLALLLVFFTILAADAKPNKSLKLDLNSIINNSEISKNSIAISIKNLDTGNSTYEHNATMLMHPASIQKILTLIPAIEILGNDYEFSTIIYQRLANNYVIKLGADPYLTSKELKKLSGNISVETQKIYIDDNIIERKSWGEGWQWDDDMNTLMPRFNSYNLDKNLIKITIIPTQKGTPATIVNPSKYPIVFINNVITDNKNEVSVNRDNSISANTLTLNGTINKPVVLNVPINNLKQYFDIKLKNILEDKKIYLKQNFIISETTSQDKKLDAISHPISLAIDDILKNSNNMVSETVSKLAGGKAYNTTGSDTQAIKIFNDYCIKHKLDNSKIRLTDASGVSKNNLITSDFVTNFLILNKNNEVLTHMATPGEGTLTNRMLPLKENLRAKTGTLSDISSIAGYITSQKGNKYAFCIIINEPSTTESEKKSLEDYIIREIYFKI